MFCKVLTPETNHRARTDCKESSWGPTAHQSYLSRSSEAVYVGSTWLIVRSLKGVSPADLQGASFEKDTQTLLDECESNDDA